MSLLHPSRTALPELEMVPLAERLRAMALFRLVLVGLLMAASVSLSGVLHGELHAAIAGTAAYLILSVAGYLLWRLWPGRGLVLFSTPFLPHGPFFVLGPPPRGGGRG